MSNTRLDKYALFCCCYNLPGATISTVKLAVFTIIDDFPVHSEYLASLDWVQVVTVWLALNVCLIFSSKGLNK